MYVHPSVGMHVRETHQLDSCIFSLYPLSILFPDLKNNIYIFLIFLWRYIHIFMVDHRSTSLPECWPTEYKAPEPSVVVYFCSVLFTPILFYLLYKYSLLSVFSNVLFTLQNSPINPAFDWKKNTYSCQRSWRVSEIIFVQFRAPLDIQWRAQGGAKGPCPPPNRKVRGPMYHLAPPIRGT